MWTVISWVAVLLGFAGTWLAARHSSGWLIGAACSLLWLAYDIVFDIPAGAFAAVVAALLSARNWWVCRRECRDGEPNRKA